MNQKQLAGTIYREVENMISNDIPDYEIIEKIEDYLVGWKNDIRK